MAAYLYHFETMIIIHDDEKQYMPLTITSKTVFRLSLNKFSILSFRIDQEAALLGTGLQEGSGPRWTTRNTLEAETRMLPLGICLLPPQPVRMSLKTRYTIVKELSKS